MTTRAQAQRAAAAPCWRRWFCAGTVALLAAGCATLPAVDGAGQSYAGRFSLAVDAPPATDPEVSAADAAAATHAWTGRFTLRVAEGGLSLDLVSPLGSTIARFETDPREARLVVPQDGGLRVEHGASLDALAQAVLGWSLPVGGLASWVQGHPAGDRPFVPAAQPEQSAGMVAFAQDGWDVVVQEPGRDRAGRLVQARRAARDGLPGVALRVVLDAPAGS